MYGVVQSINTDASALVHVWMNRWFFKTILKCKFTFSLAANAFITIMLLVSFIVLCISGMVNARFIFTFLHGLGGSTARDLHAVSAYWCLVLVGVHAGLHWVSIKKYPIFNILNNLKRHGLKLCVLLVEVAIFISGVWAVNDREILPKLFFSVGFEYWDKNRPQVLFYLVMLSIIIAIALFTKTLMRVFLSITRRNQIDD